MIRLSEYVINFIAKQGVKHIFMVSGGSGMYLIDSLGHNKDVQYVCNHHEQASAMSAEGYQRITGNLGVALVTTGPAGTNAITGVGCSWNDSIPVMFISGQSNSKFLIGNTGLRQHGVHESNITKIVESITKYAVTVTDELKIRYHMEKALYLAKSGRPGPVWVDIPIDIQSKMINPNNLISFNPNEEFHRNTILKHKETPLIKTVVKCLKEAQRPIILAGHGIRLADIQLEFIKFIEKYKIPVVTTKNGFDLIYDDHELLAGRIGINGQRAGNFAVQNADLVLVLGSRLSFPTIGYTTEYFARDAKKIVVDIDDNQLKHSTIKTDLTINLDLKTFLTNINQMMENNYNNDNSKWIDKCHHWRIKYLAVPGGWKHQTMFVDSYYFFEVLSEEMNSDDILITDQGVTFYASTVAFKLKQHQRVFTNGGFSPMGYGLPSAIGACFANNNKRIICAHGDGGLEMNIQELQTIVHYKLPIKLFVFNNEGYLSIKNTQTTYFDGFFVGSEPNSGVSCPDFTKIASAYGIPSIKIKNHLNIRDMIKQAINSEGPLIIEIISDPMEAFLPKVVSEKKPDGTMISKPLEDMYPFLNRKEFNEEMIVKPVGD